MKTFNQEDLEADILETWGKDSQQASVFYKMMDRLAEHGIATIEADLILEKPKRNYCAGCEDEYYHIHHDKCWSFDSAKLMLRKKVSIDQVPPWNQEAEPYLSCYKVKRFIFVRPDQVR